MTHPPINFEKLGPVDLDRFERAIGLYCQALHEPGEEYTGQYVVRHVGDPLRQEHYVDLVSNDIPRCDCGDFGWRDKLCKHILACLVHENHPVAQDAMVEWVTRKRI